VAEARVERRLVAILAANVASYGRLMVLTRKAPLGALKAYRRDLIDLKFTEHSGSDAA
jgi:adenylate cyclase